MRFGSRNGPGSAPAPSHEATAFEGAIASDAQARQQQSSAGEQLAPGGHRLLPEQNELRLFDESRMTRGSALKSPLARSRRPREACSENAGAPLQEFVRRR